MQDWSMNVQPPDKVVVPSFIRLFMFARILKQCNVSVDQIKQMVTTIHDLKQQQVACDILTRLRNNGIKKYMAKWFNEKEQMKVIEVIFSRIILTQFEKEYHAIITYKAKNGTDTRSGAGKSQYYQTLVFNTHDLMCFIFQFMSIWQNFIGDLINCGLVNSNWLYQSWNPNSLYHLTLHQLMTNTAALMRNKKAYTKHKSKKSYYDRILSSKWQRIVNVKSVRIVLYQSDKFNKLQLEYLLEKMCMLRSVVDIALFLHHNYIALLKQLVYYNKEKIGKYFVRIRDTQAQNMLKPLELANGKDIFVSTMYYNIMWSHRCQILRLNISKINENWIKYVIENCDCSGIHTIILENISFCSLLNPDLKSIQFLFNKFAQKFENLQNLTLKHDSTKTNKIAIVNVVLLLRCLSCIIKKNNTHVSLYLFLSFGDCDKLGKMIHDTGIKIAQLALRRIKVSEESFTIDCLKPVIINNQQLEYLRIEGWVSDERAAQTWILDLLLTMEKEEEKSHLSSLKMINIYDNAADTSINTINQILSLKLIKKHHLYIKLNVCLTARHSRVLQESFKTLCQNVASLLISQEIAIEFDIGIDEIAKTHFDKTYYPMFEQYFNQDKLGKEHSKAPIVNEYCNPLAKPLISLEFYEDDEYGDDVDFDGDMRFKVYNAKRNFEYLRV